MRRFKVSGICLVPAHVEMEIDAKDEFDAITKAKASHWQPHIQTNSHDNGSAFDWEVYIDEEITGKESK